jgi:hypothetical protein
VDWPEFDKDEESYPGNTELWLPVGSSNPDISEEDLPALMFKATSNLASCPAFQGAAAPQELVLSNGNLAEAEGEGPDAAMNSSTRTALLRALAPVAAGVRRVVIELHEFELGQQELAALGEVFRDQITRLYLQACEIQGSFWPALLKTLPSLRELEIWCSGTGAIDETNLIGFCSHVSRPFTLKIDEDFEQEARVDVEKLQSIAWLHGSPLELQVY